MYPEVLIRIWMSSKSDASMIIGISMGQEICLIHGQVSHNLLYWKKKLPTDIVVRGEIDEKTADIQARSFMARTLGENGKDCQAKGEAKSRQKKSLTSITHENCEGMYFIDPEDKEFKETIRNARKKLELPMAPAMPCKTCKKCKHGETRGKTNEFKSKLACMLGASDPQDCVWKNLYRIIMRTILQERETVHCSITTWFTNLFLCLKQ